ncbi:HNH endonuclease signature motif containing protein [Streptomyces sp. NPDC001530]|uniref:HNH endonuclease signature motif containing protein n=1 Tax=Streptomyces sp. NPDC001530 TaxID=3364582 RepID=UPI00369C5766
MSTVNYGDERLPERFWTKVAAQPSGCWLWVSTKNPRGYGNFWKAGTHRPAHRVAYEALVGPIPEGADVRHDCDIPSCVNPNHLRTGTRSENMRDCLERGRNAQAAKEFCLQGHPYSEENTYVRPSGARTCRTCQREAVHRYQRRNIGSAADAGGAA